MANEEFGLSEETSDKVAKVGEVAATAGAMSAGMLTLGPAGALIAPAAAEMVKAAPREAKIAGGLAAGIGATSALEGIVLAGGIAAAPAIVTVVVFAGAAGAIGLGGAWLWKKLSE